MWFSKPQTFCGICRSWILYAPSGCSRNGTPIFLDPYVLDTYILRYVYLVHLNVCHVYVWHPSYFDTFTLEICLLTYMLDTYVFHTYSFDTNVFDAIFDTHICCTCILQWMWTNGPFSRIWRDVGFDNLRVKNIGIKYVDVKKTTMSKI